MARAFFLTGTDTGVGKTLVATALLHAGAERDWRTAGVKPVAAGCEMLEGQLRHRDALLLQSAASLRLPYAQVNPVALEPAIAPHIAARAAGLTLEAQRLADHCENVRRTGVDLMIVEGAGGWLVPLSDTETMADLVVRLAIPVVLVVALRLGCLNHALLTADSIRAHGLELAAWVANCLDPAMVARDANLETLKMRLPAPCIGVLPQLGDDVSPARVAACLDTATLFQ